MNNTTLRYAKSVMQLEKGLPPNGVVPILKEKVEVMRERVSVGDICGCYTGVGRWIWGECRVGCRGNVWVLYWSREVDIG